jgi:hypothetical protein
MEIKLGGAFAGYFALVLLIIAELPRINDVVNPSPSQVWIVEGQLLKEDGKGVDPLSPKDIKFEPDILVFPGNGWFKATFATQMSSTGHGIKFPSLYLSHEGGYTDLKVDLGPPTAKAGMGNQDTRDEDNHYIKLKGLILSKPPDYSAKGPTPIPASEGTYVTDSPVIPQGAPHQ